MRKRITTRLRALDAGESRNRTGDFDLNPDAWLNRHLTPAAVLVPLVEHDDGLWVLLTRRTDHLNDHAGQVSFPGGRVEAHDPGPVGTALRETHEEIGLEPTRVDVAGLLDTYETGTGFLVTPVVGFVRPGFRLTLDTFEVAEAFEVPLDFILNPTNHRVESVEIRGADRLFYVFDYEGHRIWGATAGMLMNLFRRLSPEEHG